MKPNSNPKSWLNRTVLGVGLASLLSDWSHEIATAVLPAFLATIGAGAAWLGLIEGLADGLSSLAKLGSGVYTDKLAKRKSIAVIGYLVTALGTASFGLASSAWQVLLARSCAWLGRGVRTPVRKALLAGSVTKESYGRAFGFERMMDTVGAIIGPVSALLLVSVTHHHYPTIFALTLIPGLAAAVAIATLVKEKERRPVSHVSFGQRLRALPVEYRKFLLAVGVFGTGSIAHTMLILLAVQKLTPTLGAAKASSVAVALYILHNVVSAACAPLGGWLGDHFRKDRVLAVGFFAAALMTLCVIALAPTIWTLALVFMLGGMSAALEDTLEDSFCAELVNENHHGIAFGVLATVNGVGDLISSIVVGALWTAFGVSTAFVYSSSLSLIGTILILSLKRHPESYLRIKIH